MRGAPSIVLACGAHLAAAGCAAHDPPTDWIVLDARRPDIGADVAAQAADAIARGKTPVLYLTAPYTLASASLVAARDRLPMREALEGIVVLELDPTLTTAYEPLLRGYWHSFHGIGPDGQVTSAALDPGTKDGPCADGDVDRCAAWIRPFLRSLVGDRGRRAY